MMFKRLIPLLCAAPFLLYANEPTYQLQQLKTRVRVDYQQVRMPDGEKSMGLAGLHYQLLLNNWLYTGLGAYGSVSGDRGGFLTTGVEAGISHTLFGKVKGDIGVYYGAGGGADAPVGSGSLFEPYVGVAYDFGGFDLGLAYHYFKTFNGRINSSQAALFMDVPLTLHYASPAYAGIDFEDINHVTFNGGSPYAEKDYISVVFNNIFPKKGSKNTAGDTQDHLINLVGAEFGHYFNDAGFVFGRLEGAYKGIPAGYKQAIIGAGYSFDLIPGYVVIQPKLGTGTGGGGGADTGGGYLFVGEVGVDWFLTEHLGLQLNGGYFKAPQGHFEGPTASLALQYIMDLGSFNIMDDNSALSKAYFQGWKIKAGNVTVLKAQRTSGQKQTLNLITTDLDFMLGKYAYLAGQTGIARAGNAGGFTTAMAGFGLTTSSRVGLYAQVLAGAGGSGGVDTHQGLLGTAEIGAYARITENWGIQTAFGRMKSLDGGKLNANVVNASISYNFSSLMGW